MTITNYPDSDTVNAAISQNAPLMLLISFDGGEVIISCINDTVEHHVLLARTGHSSLDTDKYFHIIADKSGADWTFVCPPDYKGIEDKRRRVGAFYKDGFAVISGVLEHLGYYVGLNIPQRYSRHIKQLSEE